MIAQFNNLTDDVRQRAYIDLLDNIAITEDGDTPAFRRIKRLREELQQWYSTRPGWTVLAERDFVRLIKVPSSHRTSGELQRLQEPLDYEMAVWILWHGEKSSEPLFLLSELTEEVSVQANLEREGERISWTNHLHRRSLVRAIATLIDLGAIRRHDGDAQAWADSQEGNVLYEYTDLAQRLELSEWELEENEDRSATTPEARLYRHLLLSPLLQKRDDPEAFALLQRRDTRRQVRSEIEERFGWNLHVAENHACVLRPQRALPRRTFPRPDTLSQISILLCGRVRELIDAGQMAAAREDRVAITRNRIEQTLIDLREEHGRNWPKGVQNDSLDKLLSQTTAYMKEWGLLEGPDIDGLYYMTPLAAGWDAVYTNREDALSTMEDDR